MKYGAFATLLVMLMAQAATACISEDDLTSDGGNLLIGDFDYTQTRENYCDNPADGSLRCCQLTSSGSQTGTNYTAIVMKASSVPASPGFNVTMYVRPTISAINAYHTAFGLGNYTGLQAYRQGEDGEFKHGLVDVQFTYPNVVKLFCGNAPDTAVSTCTNCAVQALNQTIQFSKDSSDSLVHVRINTSYLGNCSFPSANGLVFLPYMSVFTESTSNSNDGCVNMWRLYVRNNYSITNTIGLYLDGLNKVNTIANCSLTQTPIFGQHPFASWTTNDTGQTTTLQNTYNPSCELGDLTNPNTFRPWTYAASVQASCLKNSPPYDTYATSSGGALMYTNAGLAGQTLNISVYSTETENCAVYFNVVNESGAAQTNSQVSIKLWRSQGGIDVAPYSFGNGTFYWDMFICGESFTPSAGDPPKYAMKEFGTQQANDMTVTLPLTAVPSSYPFTIQVNVTNAGTTTPGSITTQVCSVNDPSLCSVEAFGALNSGCLRFPSWPTPKNPGANYVSTWMGLSTDLAYVCAWAKGVSGAQETPRVQALPVAVGTLQYNFTLSLDQNPEALKNLCIRFVESVDGTDVPIGGSNFSIWSGNVPVVLNQAANATGDYCFQQKVNSLADLSFTYTTANLAFNNANRENNGFEWTDMNSLGRKKLYLARLAVIQTYAHVSGYVNNSDTGASITVFPVKLTCDEQNFPNINTNGTGFFNFTGIVIGKQTCTLDVADLQYEADPHVLTMNAPKNQNLRTRIRNLSHDTTIEVVFRGYSMFEGDSSSRKLTDGIKISLDGGWKTCVTRDGKCALTLLYGSVHRLKASLDGYFDDDQELTVTRTSFDVEVTKPRVDKCYIQGNLLRKDGNVTGGGIAGKVQLFNGDGFMVQEKQADATGYYNFDVECGQQYNVNADVNGYKQTIRVMSGTGEGSIAKFDVTFDISDVGFMEELKSFKRFLYALFGFAFIIVLLFLFLVVMMLIRAIYYGDTYKRGGRYEP